METKKISPNFLLKNMGKNKMKGSATVIAIVIVLVAMGSSVITWMYAKNFKMESSPISDENKKTSMILTENAASSTALMSGVFYGKSFAGTRLNGAENQVVLVDDGKEFVIDQSLDPVLEKTEDIESSEGAQFGNLQFSPKGRFLAYDYSGWDVSGTKVYDVREKKVLI